MLFTKLCLLYWSQGNLDWHGNPSWFSGLQDESNFQTKISHKLLEILVSFFHIMKIWYSGLHLALVTCYYPNLSKKGSRLKKHTLARWHKIAVHFTVYIDIRSHIVWMPISATYQGRATFTWCTFESNFSLGYRNCWTPKMCTWLVRTRSPSWPTLLATTTLSQNSTRDRGVERKSTRSFQKSKKSKTRKSNSSWTQRYRNICEGW